MSRSPFRYPYEVNNGGIPDLSRYLQRKTIEPLLKGLQNRDNDAISRISKELQKSEDPSVQEIAKSITGKGTPAFGAPASIPPARKRISLSDCSTEQQSVGWGSPIVNRLPGPDFVLQSGGEMFARGIYAHAPASHPWDLGGKWHSLTGSAGLATGHPGSVVFSLYLDGKKKWSSRTLKSGDRADFQIDLTNAKTLELRTDNAGDGNGGDWGLWLAPVLHRNQ